MDAHYGESRGKEWVVVWDQVVGGKLVVGETRVWAGGEDGARYWFKETCGRHRMIIDVREA